MTCKCCFDDNMIHIEKWYPEKPLACVYYDGDKENWFVKRFLVESSSKPIHFITAHENSRLGVVSTAFFPVANIRYNKKFKHTRDKEDDLLDLNDFISVKGLKALGNKLSSLPVTDVTLAQLDEEKEAKALEELIAARKTNSDEATSNSAETAGAEPEPTSEEAKTSVSAKPAVEKKDGVPDEVSQPIELSVDTEPDDDGQITMF